MSPACQNESGSIINSSAQYSLIKSHLIADFGGTLGTTEGDIILTQDGRVKVIWGDKTVTGSVTGDVLNGRYYSARYPEMIWDFNMTLKPDRKNCIFFHAKQGGVLFNTRKKYCLSCIRRKAKKFQI